MLGSRLLAAPVFSEEGDAEFYLPAGRWTDWFTGEETEGGRFVRGKYDFFSLPLYVRENTILPVGANDRDAAYDYADGAVLRCYAPGDGAEAVIRDLTGKTVLRDTAERDGKTVVHRIEGERKNLSLLLVNVHAVSGLEGGTAEDTTAGLKIAVSADRVKYTEA